VVSQGFAGVSRHAPRAGAPTDAPSGAEQVYLLDARQVHDGDKTDLLAAEEMVLLSLALLDDRRLASATAWPSKGVVDTPHVLGCMLHEPIRLDCLRGLP
jgi:hypothetical protein